MTLDLDTKTRILQLWDALCADVGLSPEVIAEFLRSEAEYRTIRSTLSPLSGD